MASWDDVFVDCFVREIIDLVFVFVVVIVFVVVSSELNEVESDGVSVCKERDFVNGFVHFVAPVDLVNVPFGHGVHHDESVASVALEYVLSGHGVGDVELIRQKFPRPHAIAGAEALGQYVPGRQAYEKFQTRSTMFEKP